MGIQERRERERQALRKKILEAARTLFVAHGFDAVSMRKIATAVEYSPTAIYLHFPDKQSILEAICDEDFLALAKRFRKIAGIEDPIERLRAAGKAYAEFGLSHPHHYQLMFMTPHPPHPPEKSRIERGNPEQDAYAFLKWTVGEAISAGRLRPGLDDVELVSQLVWSGVHGIASLLITKTNEPWIDWRPRRQLIDEMLEMTLNGILREGD